MARSRPWATLVSTCGSSMTRRPTNSPCSEVMPLHFGDGLSTRLQNLGPPSKGRVNGARPLAFSLFVPRQQATRSSHHLRFWYPHQTCPCAALLLGCCHPVAFMIAACTV